MHIRVEQPEDRGGIYEVNSQAFARPDKPLPVPEAELVDRLRASNAVILSLVAVVDGQIAGHILFSPGRIVSVDRQVPAVALAPMAVLPAYQNQGIGSQLVRSGIEMLRQAGHEILCVLGHPDYYPRFGFIRARSNYNVECEYNVPDEVFMAIELKPGALSGNSGVFYYHPDFQGV